jgi:RNA polymerase sigma factor (sigma-70 family)
MAAPLLEAPPAALPSPPSAARITDVLDRWRRGDDRALGELMPLVVEDLRRIARRYLAREAPGHTLQPTALVNEVYLRLVGGRLVGGERGGEPAGPTSTGAVDRSQFFACASRLMREVLVDHARARLAAKRGGGLAPLAIERAARVAARQGLSPETQLALDEALGRLADLDPRQGRVVELRYFAGLTLEEIAEVLGISRASAERDWAAAKRWLAREMTRAR